MKSVKTSAMRCTVAVVSLGALAAISWFPRDASIATVYAQQVEGPRARYSDFGGFGFDGSHTPSISQEESGILGRYKATQDEAERKTIVQELTAEVERQFEARQSKRAAELKELRERLTRLGAIHARRSQEKSRIITDRVEQLLRDVDGLGWGQDLQESPGPAGPAGRIRSTPGGAALKPLPAGEVRSDNGLNMKLVWIPPGDFQQGSRDGDENELPRHHVNISHGFFLGQTEVTKSQWEAMMQTRPWEGQENVNEAKDTPATHVSWEDAVAFCQRFNDKERQDGRLQTGWRYTLPTESQWEYACRGASNARYSFGDDETALGDYAWYAKNVLNVGEKYAAHQVGVKRPNRYGLYDMHGNVSEWCRDWFDIAYYGHSSDRNPVGPVAGTARVVRGGSWNSPPRSAGRRAASGKTRRSDSTTWASASPSRRVASSCRARTCAVRNLPEGPSSGGSRSRQTLALPTLSQSSSVRPCRSFPGQGPDRLHSPGRMPGKSSQSDHRGQRPGRLSILPTKGRAVALTVPGLPLPSPSTCLACWHCATYRGRTVTKDHRIHQPEGASPRLSRAATPHRQPDASTANWKSCSTREPFFPSLAA